MDTIFLLIRSDHSRRTRFQSWRSRCAPGAWPSEPGDLARSGERVRTGHRTLDGRDSSNSLPLSKMGAA